MNAALEARLAPRAAVMGREEQKWKEKQQQERCEQLQGEQQGRKRLFLNWSLGASLSVQTRRSACLPATVSYHSLKFQQARSRRNKCLFPSVFLSCTLSVSFLVPVRVPLYPHITGLPGWFPARLVDQTDTSQNVLGFSFPL